MTSQLSGATSYKNTAFGIISREEVVQLEIEGIKRGLEWVYSKLKQHKSLSINSKFILELHKKCFGDIFPDWAGKYRLIQVSYSGKEAPPYFQIPELITNLCLDLKERTKHLPSQKSEKFTDELISLLSWFQHQFVFIHPFQDYNGRMARLLMNIILLNLNLPPVEINVDAPRARSNYLAAIQAADDGDYSKLNLLLTKALNEAYNAI